ncbi:MAG: NCS2 family permease [Planctomycetes bacterium]|nr:NCS2 family permease [Planctomycetota bacterium]
MSHFLERRFRLRERGTSVGIEVVAGLTTFATLSYILFVQPAVLSSPGCGMDAGGVLFATCVASALACFLMAWWADYPIALAPGMGHNFFFAFTICATLGWSWREALAANLIAGLAFLALASFGLRERVMNALPGGLAHGIAAGIGLLIAFIGLQWGGLVRAHPATLVQLGELSHPVALHTLAGLALAIVLLARGVRGALLVAIALSALGGWAASRAFGLSAPLVEFTGVIGAPPDPRGTAFQLDFSSLFARAWTDWLPIVLIFLTLVLFDTIGTLVGVAGKAGLMVGGKLPRAERALAADAAGTTLGALLGTSTVTSYVESAAGVSAGGRTGLTAIVVGLCFLATLVFAPLVHSIGAGVDVGGGVLRYPVIAPVLIVVGALMFAELRHVKWDDPVESFPAFLCAIVMQLSVSITEGVAIGFVACSLLAVATGRARAVSPLVHGFALFFAARWIWLAG